MTFIYFLLLAAAAVVLLAVAYWLLLKKTMSRQTDADEIYAVTTDDLWKLRLYRYRSTSGSNEPVLLVHSALANHRNFAAPAGANLIKTLTERGYDCWVLELRGTRSSEPPHSKKPWEVVFDDYILHDLPTAVDAVVSLTGMDRVHYVGHSLGGMVLYAYCLTHANPGIASAATLGAPPGLAGARIRPSYTLLGLYKTFPRLSEKLLRALTPFLSIYKPRLHFLPLNWDNMHDDLTITDYFNMLDSQPPQVVSQLAYWLESNTWHADHSQVNILEELQSLELPLLTIFGQQDPFIPAETAHEFFEALLTDDKELIVLAEYSHCDLAFGRNGEREVFEPIADWFAAHPIRADHPAEKAPRKKPVKKRAKAALSAPVLDDVEVEVTPESVEPESITPEIVTPQIVVPAQEDEPPPTAPKRKVVTRRKSAPATAKTKKAPVKKAAAKKAPAKKKAAAPKKAAAKSAPAAKKKPATRRKPSTGGEGIE